MTAIERRAEIMRILTARRSSNIRTLAAEMGVCRRTICTDIEVLTADYPLETSRGNGGAALLMEMGTGKTLTTIAIVGCLRQEKCVQRLLVVASLSILGVLEDEFRKFAEYDYSLAVLEGTGTRKTDIIRHMTGAALQVLVMNYESAWKRS